MSSLFLIGLLLSASAVVDTAEGDTHAIYISVIEIDHKDSSKPSKLMIKVFTDDLENALRNAFDRPFQLPDAKACQAEGDSIEDYFGQRFKLEVNGNKTAINFQKGEKHGDSTWLHFGMDGPKEWQELVITANFFMELFPTQTTTLTVYYGTAMWFKKFTKDEVACRINL